jgi:hypothetical protein
VSDWYRNIKADPQVEVWLPDGWWRGEAEEITSPVSRVPILREVLIAGGSVVTGMLGIDPAKASDEEIAKLTEDYKLIRIHRTEARTGADGPGELAWIWPLATFALVPLVLVMLLALLNRRK